MKKQISKQQEEVKEISISPIHIESIRLRAVGISPLLCNNAKDLVKIIDGKPIFKGYGEEEDNNTQGKKTSRTKKGTIRNPQKEYNDSRYIIDDETDGFPAHRMKEAAISVAKTFCPNVDKNFVKGAIYIPAEYHGWLLRIDTAVFPPVFDERIERIGGRGPQTGTPDPRFRPRYDDWSIPFTVQFMNSLISLANVVNLFNMAGYCAGLGEHRPQKGGDLGRFSIVTEDDWERG